ncbi:hypothetical protein PHMEG_00037144 [Phytophthora megakarya]|uniref:Uncharacterized protein n=1 Tax=Phytophthora megakarya TaxID=4795 RepID=A0A225UMU5_9STRA|nr:hypothetical protein PHMEG_00037144 [Phytophthora megakarya]
MVGHSASALQAETLSAGDRIEYFSRAFVCGDRRGHRSAVVVCVDAADYLYPIRLDTEELLPHENMMRKTEDQFGKPVDSTAWKWRKLRTFELVPVTFSAPAGPASRTRP